MLRKIVMLLSVHVTSVLFLVWFNNFGLSTAITGLDWTSGLDWWTDTKNNFYTFQQLDLLACRVMWEPHQPSLCTHSHGTNKYRPTVIAKGFVASNVILVFAIVKTACSYNYG